MQKHVQQYLAEVFGTYVLVFVGAGAVIGFGSGVAPFAFGFALLTGLYIFGEISGGHFNPIVSLSMLLDRRMSAKEVGPYWIAQFVGAVLAALCLLLMTSSDDVAKAATVPQQGVRAAFFVELFCSALFMLVILVVTKSEAAKSVTYIVIGLSMMAFHFTAVPFSGSGLNPARSFGTALVGNTWTDFWIYILAPLAGAILGWLVYAVVIKGDMNLKDDFKGLRTEVGSAYGRGGGAPEGPGDGTRGTGGPPPEGPGDGTRDTA
jgi:aquaporin Z